MNGRSLPAVLSALLMLLVTSTVELSAQRIDFGVYASAGIIIDQIEPLNFNDKQSNIITNSNSSVTISIADQQAVIVGITAEGNKDIMVTITSPAELILDGGGTNKSIPFQLRYAYSNVGVSEGLAAKSSAIEVPSGFTSVTLPMSRRTAGVPMPPPTPLHTGYTVPTTKAYLYLYGVLGPVGSVNAGIYTGTIDISVEYAGNN